MTFFESLFYMAWRGIAIGLIISAPMGPVGMLCIQRTLDKGRRAGLYTGIGAAISDLFYSLLTGFGLSFIEDFLERNQNIIQLVGSLVLIGFGIYLFRKNPSKGLKKPIDENVSVEKSILGGFLFTVSNPLILFLIIGLFARFNFILPANPGGMQIAMYVTGFIFILVGALIWWWFITFSIDKVRSHFNIRSMWLINKIIGIIIFLFAIVGIVTASTALASAENVRCWNERRGFESFSSNWKDHSAGSAGTLINRADRDTLFFLTDCGNSGHVDFRFKAANPRPVKSAWGMVLKGTDGGNTVIAVSSSEGESDGISSSAQLCIEATAGKQKLASSAHSDKTNLLPKIMSGPKGPDPSGKLNFFRIEISGDVLSLFGGWRTPQLLTEFNLPVGFKTDSIGFFLCPGAEIEFSDISMTTNHNGTPHLIWDDPEILRDYLDRSADPMEGYWQILDRSLEESLIRPGGDYRLAIVKSGKGYDLIYLAGASVNASEWTPGMVKGSLTPSGIRGIWDVEWRDAMFGTMNNSLKAQRDINGVLTIQFPYQNSSLRLIRTQ